jgi:enoyl-[acyl-carrier protein] reductase II
MVIKTRLTEMLGIKHPIMNSGMSFVVEPPLVAAVSNAGGLGMLATGPYTPRKTREAIKQVRCLTDKPFGCNVTLLFPNSKENVEVCLEEKVPVINWSLGKADWIIKALHEYGGKALGTVVLSKHAIAAEKDGADGLIITGHEAAGHGGDVTSLILIPTIAQKVKIPVIAAGGFATGRGLAAALALGAEGVSVGTRFAFTKESAVHQHIKDLCLAATEIDTIYSDKFDGLNNRVLKTKNTERIAKRIGFRPVKALRSAILIKQLIDVPFGKLVISGLRSTKGVMRMARQAEMIADLRKAIIDGDEKHGLIVIGQAIGLVNKEMAVEEVINSMVAEAQQILEEIGKRVIE